MSSLSKFPQTFSCSLGLIYTDNEEPAVGNCIVQLHHTHKFMTKANKKKKKTQMEETRN